MKEYFDDFKKRVRKIAFTDSVHSLDLHNVKSSTRRWISAVSRSCNHAIINMFYLLFLPYRMPLTGLPVQIR